MRQDPHFSDIYIIDKFHDWLQFEGWDILQIEDWKPGVKRIHMRKVNLDGSGKFEMVYADESAFIALNPIRLDALITHLGELAESKGEILYAIQYRIAGIGFQWFDETIAGDPPSPLIFLFRPRNHYRKL